KHHAHARHGARGWPLQRRRSLRSVAIAHALVIEAQLKSADVGIQKQWPQCQFHLEALLTREQGLADSARPLELLQQLRTQAQAPATDLTRRPTVTAGFDEGTEIIVEKALIDAVTAKKLGEILEARLGLR